MNKIVLSLASALLVISINVQAQDLNTRYIKQHLPQTEASLAAALDRGDNWSVQARAAQTVRDMELLFPDIPFASLIPPLVRNVTNEQANTQVRLLCALALDGLHDKDGDAAIAGVVASSSNTSVRDLCTVLLLKGDLGLTDFGTTPQK